MQSYEFLPHLSDIRLKVKGDCLEELFAASMQGMGTLIKGESCIFKENNNKQLKEKIEISSIDLTSLLTDFLSEVLVHSQINKNVYCKIKFEKINSNFLSAYIFGEKTETFDKDIKTVTYNETGIIKDKDGIFSTIVIFNI